MRLLWLGLRIISCSLKVRCTVHSLYIHIRRCIFYVLLLTAGPTSEQGQQEKCWIPLPRLKWLMKRRVMRSFFLLKREGFYYLNLEFNTICNTWRSSVDFIQKYFSLCEFLFNIFREKFEYQPLIGAKESDEMTWMISDCTPKANETGKLLMKFQN